MPYHASAAFCLTKIISLLCLPMDREKSRSALSFSLYSNRKEVVSMKQLRFLPLLVVLVAPLLAFAPTPTQANDDFEQTITEKVSECTHDLASKSVAHTGIDLMIVHDGNDSEYGRAHTPNQNVGTTSVQPVYRTKNLAATAIRQSFSLNDKTALAPDFNRWYYAYHLTRSGTSTNDFLDSQHTYRFTMVQLA